MNLFLSNIAASKAARWLSAYISAGLRQLPEAHHRRNRVLNSLCLYASLTAFPYSLLYAAVDGQALYPLILFVACGSIATFCLPLAHRFGPNASLRMFSVIWVMGVLVIAFYLGTGSGIHFIFFSFSALWTVMIGLKNWRELLFWQVIGMSAFVFAETTFPVPYYLQAEQFLSAFVFYTFGLNAFVLIVGIVIYTLLLSQRAEDALEVEHARSEALLYNLLPAEIAARLKNKPDEIIADNLPQVAILFADIANFTPRAINMAPESVVGFLNNIFSAFDELAETHGLEKIKTIGDAYMVAAGMPKICSNPGHRIAEMALDMLMVTEALSDEMGENINVRIGLHIGPAVAGVIGSRKLFYDVWGETVNTASRMESHGAPGRVQVTEAAWEELKDDFTFEHRGIVQIKGMGDVETWWLTGRA